jgi:hypothetical protein
MAGTRRLIRLSSQLCQQCLGLLEVGGVKAFSEPAVHLGEQLAGCGASALVLPQPRQAHRRPQLPRLRLLVADNAEDLLEADFRRITGAPVSQIRRPEPTSFE